MTLEYIDIWQKSDKTHIDRQAHSHRNTYKNKDKHRNINYSWWYYYTNITDAASAGATDATAADNYIYYNSNN